MKAVIAFVVESLLGLAVIALLLWAGYQLGKRDLPTQSIYVPTPCGGSPPHPPQAQ